MYERIIALSALKALAAYDRLGAPAVGGCGPGAEPSRPPQARRGSPKARSPAQVSGSEQRARLSAGFSPGYRPLSTSPSILHSLLLGAPRPLKMVLMARISFFFFHKDQNPPIFRQVYMLGREATAGFWKHGPFPKQRWFSGLSPAASHLPQSPGETCHPIGGSLKPSPLPREGVSGPQPSDNVPSKEFLTVSCSVKAPSWGVG